MSAWEYDLFIKEINLMVKEENERNHQEMDKAGYKDMKKMSDQNYYKKMANNSISKMPNIPKMPKI